MKACVIQPAYSTDFSKSEEYFEKQLELLTKVDENVDIIVLPESADCPCLAKNEDERKIAFEKFNEVFIGRENNLLKFNLTTDFSFSILYVYESKKSFRK